MPWHPPPPSELEDDLRLLVDRNAVCIAEAIAKIEVEEPAFALCLWPSEEMELAAGYISLGLERDRESMIAEGTPWEAAIDVWIGNDNYTYDELEVRDPRSERAFREAEARIIRWLEAAEIEEPERWAMEEVAHRITREPPPIPLTDDFVAFVFEQGDDLTASLRWIAPSATQRILESKRLLVDDDDALPGAPDYDALLEEALLDD